LLTGLLLAGSLIAIHQAVRAADPVTYDVTLTPTGNAAIDSAAHDASTLIALRSTAPAGPFALIARARGDVTRFQTVLNSFGYYAGQASITIDRRPLDDAGLTEALDAVAAATKVPVVVTLTPGPLFHLGRVTLQGDVPPEARSAFRLDPGAPAVASEVLAAHDRLLAALQSEGHALAKVGPPQATLNPAAHELDVAFDVQAGPRVDLGAIDITGLSRLRESYIRRRLELHPGEPYDPARIEAAREDLASVGAVGGVRISTPDSLDSQGRLPVRVDVSERPLHAVNLTAAFSTDQGGSVTASWMHRNLFGNAEQLTLSAGLTGLGGSAATQPGYNVNATLVLPDWLRRDQSLTFQATGVKEYLEAYERTAVLGSITLARKLTPDWTASVGVAGEKAQFVQEDITRDYTLAQLPVGLTYDTAHNLFDPTHGVKAAALITPTVSLGSGNGGTTSLFTIAQLSASTYIDFSGAGRSILALRGLVGTVQGAGVFDIPPDQRFYAGGGGTIRGYRFQSVGPKFPDGKPSGGNSIDVGSFGASYGAVAFVDAGQSGDTGAPFNGALRVGAGVGARYYTSIGPIRFDIAVPLIHQVRSDSLEAYIGLGQAF
jgi:translocation and assembly module TamA